MNKPESVLTDEEALRAHKEVCDEGWICNPLVTVRHIEQAILAKLAEKAGLVNLREAAWRDLAYIDGVKAGWNYAIIEDNEGFNRAISGGGEAVSILKTTDTHPPTTPALVEAAEKALAVIERCKPLAAYGRPGTRDVEQAEFQRDMTQTESALRAAIEAHKGKA